MTARASLPALALLAAVACSQPRQLPVTLKGCSGVPGGITANLRNDGDRPVKTVYVSADFYADFRFVRDDGTADIPGGLNPGDSKDVTFSYGPGAPRGPAGRASRCLATHIEYLDGTSADLPVDAR